MSRRHVQHLLSGYIDGSLSPAATRSVEAHLASCVDCAQELAQWRAVLRLIAQYAPMSCPIDCSETVLQTLEDRRAARLIGGGGDASRSADLTDGIGGRRKPVATVNVARPLLPAFSALALAALLFGGGVRLHVASRLHQLWAPRPWALASRSLNPGAADTPELKRGANSHSATSVSPVRAHAPDRLQEAFGRSDSLILAADFVEEDR